VTENVYASDAHGFSRWNASDGTWTTLTVTGGAPAWQFRGSVIDASRNRWVYSEGANLQFIDLTTLAYTTLAVTGDAGFAADSAATFHALMHDTDNDRYILLATSGNVYAIVPGTGVATKIATVAAATNGPLSRATYFPGLGGIAYLPNYASNILFMPTR